MDQTANHLGKGAIAEFDLDEFDLDDLDLGGLTVVSMHDSAGLPESGASLRCSSCCAILTL